VNFFGHALAASWQSREPGFALGSMLPDFASMCGMRLAGASDAATLAGVAYHHATDRVFHRLEPFARGVAEIAGDLIARGAARGPARGAAHVGFELCLDGALLGDGGARAAYLDGLAAGSELAGALSWSEPDGAARWRHLCARLVERGVPLDYAEPDRVAERVGRVLAHRPLLALGPADAALVKRAMPSVAERVAAAAPAILAGLRRGLDQGAAWPGSSGET
jgi:hypothetical protein